MPNYYVSVKRGSDSAGDGSAGNPWKSIAKAIGATPAASVVGGGARVYLEPGTYYESVTLGLAPTAANPLEVVGDADGAGFLAGGYANPAVGVVDWSGWSDDVTTTTSSRCIFAPSGNYVTLRRIKFHGGQGGCIHVGSGSNWTLRDCIIVAHPAATLVYFYSCPQNLNLTVDRCDLHNAGTNGASAMYIQAPEATAEYNLGVSITNSRFFGGGRGVVISRGGAGNQGFLGRGISIRHCTFAGCVSSSVLIYQGVTVPLSTPISVVGNAFLNCYTGIEAGSTGYIAEDWNSLNCVLPRVNVTPGANSVAGVRGAVDREDGRLVGIPIRPMLEPSPGSPLAGFVGAAATTTTDLFGRSRPEGYGSTRPAAGAMDRHDSGDPDATYADAGSPACLALRGPGSLERPILVDAAATSVRVKVRWDGNHADANKPQAILLANPEIGVATDQVLTATTAGGSGSTPNAYETLSFAPVTPTRAGALMLRLVSRSASGAGTAYFDSITLS